MTPAQRRRAEVVAEVAGAKLYLAEVRIAAMRRASDLSRIANTPGHRGHLRAFLHVTARNLLAVAEAADAALSDFDGSDVDELVASM
jgi:hypothetical protein